MGIPLSKLVRMGLAVYDAIPDYRDRCPVCGGSDCAVRHGIYRRQVVDQGGRVHPRFPVPRFRCRQRGPRSSRTRTFSVLPAALVPRHRMSLPSMLHVASLFLDSGLTVAEMLDRLAFGSSAPPEDTWFPEPVAVYRALHLLLRAEGRLFLLRPGEPASSRVPDVEGPGLSGWPRSGWPRSGLRGRVRRLLGALGRASKAVSLALAFHRRQFPRLLFAP